MKLIDKFEKWLGTNPSKRVAAIQCGIIAEDYTLEVMEWYRQKSMMSNFNIYMSAAEAFDMYKREREVYDTN